MHTPGETEIAGRKTIDDWNAFKGTLTIGKKEGWDAAFADYFRERLRSRYLEPIEILQNTGGERGEGFAIVAIQCTLIEFLASTIEGKSYTPKCENLDETREYCRSAKLVIDFLTEKTPFRGVFKKKVAKAFYYSIRCGLIHEARTRDGWTISARRPHDAIIDGENKILNRNFLQDAIVNCIESYGRDLPLDTTLQESFIRKFDSLCG